MCLFIRVATSIALPEVVWSDDAPDFGATVATDGLGHLTLPFRYVLDSYTGCGCGFEQPGHAGDTWDASARSIDALVDWITAAVDAGPVEILASGPEVEIEHVVHHQVALVDFGEFDLNAVHRQPALLHINP